MENMKNLCKLISIQIIRSPMMNYYQIMGDLLSL